MGGEVHFSPSGPAARPSRWGWIGISGWSPTLILCRLCRGCVFSLLAIKTYHRAAIELPLEPASLGYQSERQEVALAEAFSSARFDVHYEEGRLLENAKDRVEAVLDNEILVARTAYQDDRYRVAIEYPIKTVNANERDWVFQPDTGPILLPDLSREPGNLIGGMELTYIAFNQEDWAEVVVRLPTVVAEGVQVYHYSRAARIHATNEVFSIGK